MSELTWYSRLAVWVGALVLLVQSITGRGLGIVTVLAVVAVTVGFAAFLAGLAAPSLVQRFSLPAAPVSAPDAPIPATDVQSQDEQPLPAEIPQAGLAGAQPEDESRQREDAHKLPAEMPGVEEGRAPTPDKALQQEKGDRESTRLREAELDETAPEPGWQGQLPTTEPGPAPIAVAPGTARGVRHPTFELSEGDARIGANCPHCRLALAAGDVAVTCLVCGTRQHAACWTANHFHCCAAGCPGHGSLEAPE